MCVFSSFDCDFNASQRCPRNCTSGNRNCFCHSNGNSILKLPLHISVAWPFRIIDKSYVFKHTVFLILTMYLKSLHVLKTNPVTSIASFISILAIAVMSLIHNNSQSNSLSGLMSQSIVYPHGHICPGL